MSAIRPYKSDSPIRWPKFASANFFYADVALGNMTQYKIGMAFTQDGLFIGIHSEESRGCFTFPPYLTHWAYVIEKLPSLLPADAKNIADLINGQFGIQCGEQGRYNDEFCINM